ncbi:hypothetical protein QUC32_12195 [Novosphingobium resinovorum]|uniref:hypothetical protein n=1 Tax=Novosphingobium TaxID=165696 RepID=UPI001B3C562B|nr:MULTISPECIES: hypothetical protein [Novosphingobium]MBF7010435.1 hypothetical protein [Novosphingobium sp. HR1a]WJM28436.1 hypothetical protein QUC32_12195 [Novosphingobium resinovorum]
MATVLKDSARKAASVVAAPAKGLKTLADNGGELHGPSPNPATNLIIADIALRTATTIMRRSVERGVLGASYSPKKAKSILKGRTVAETLLHGALARVALSSVPGAVVIGGALVAKTLYDRSRARQARAEGAAQLQDMAEDGAEEA